MLLMSTKFLVHALDWSYLSQMMREWVKDLKGVDIERDDAVVLQNHAYEFQSEEFGVCFRELFTLGGYGVEVNLKNEDDGMVHTLRCVMRTVLNEEAVALSMQLHREMLNPTAHCHARWNVPKVMRRIFWEEYGGLDNGIPTDNKSLLLRRDNLELAKNIVTQTESFFNPIVYVSPYADTGLYAVNYERLASDLLGMAHVVVEASPFIANEIRKLTNDKNPYNGACMVYLPNGETFTFLPPTKTTKQNDVSKQIIEYVQTIMAATSVGDEFSFHNLLYADLKSKVAKSHGEDSDLEKLCEELLTEKDNELLQIRSDLDNTKQELYSAQAQVLSLKDALKRGKPEIEGVTLEMTESDLYEGEIKDVLLKLIEKEYNALCSDNRTKKSRKVHVLADILEHNQMTGMDKRLSELFASAVKTGTIDNKMKTELEKEGFEINLCDNKHYKICFKGDGRYGMAISTTSSDHRAGDNLSTAFMNMLFGY